jgi:CcmD family protein
MKSLVSAYLVFGILILGYVVKLVLARLSLNREIKALKNMLAGDL